MEYQTSVAFVAVAVWVFFFLFRKRSTSRH
jgi:hypothetical protein